MRPERRRPARRGYAQRVVTLLAAGVVAGLATFLSPCVLPMVPVVFASGTAGGRRRPVGIALGLGITFVLATLLASRVLAALGLPQDLVRNLGVVLLALIGLFLVFPRLGELAGRPFRPLQTAAGGWLRAGDGFGGGLAIGAGLGVVWAPCAGPILGAVTVLAAQHRVGGEALTAKPSAGGGLPDYGVAPALHPDGDWINSKPLTLAQLRGKVVLIDFWTYSCINCLRTLPQVTAWDAKYRAAGLTIVGVHSPEFAFEHVVLNIRRAIARNHIRYPVAVDNGFETWTAYGNQYWPAEYLIDRQGHVRYASFGEGDYARTEGVIRTLLGEPAATLGVSPAIVPSDDIATPEIYLGANRANAFTQPLPNDPDAHRYTLPAELNANHVGIGGTWENRSERIVAGPGAVLELRFHARHAYVVLRPPPGEKSVTVRTTLDGRPGRRLQVDADDLYEAASPPGVAQDHVLRLRLPPGTSVYSFTFG